MSSQNASQRQRSTSHLADLPLPEQRDKAALTIQTAFREHRARKRVAQLEAFGKTAYDTLRVYHGTHEENTPGILQQGLRPQGGHGLSALIGDSRESQGKVFYTKDKQQAAYYALTGSSVAQHDRKIRAQRARDFDAYEDALADPLQPRIVRALIPVPVQQQAQPDPKGGNQDFTIQLPVPPGLVLPGHEQPDANIAQRHAAVNLFRAELNKSGVGASLDEAATTLTRLRRNSIAGDQSALDSSYAVEGAERHLLVHTFKNQF